MLTDKERLIEIERLVRHLYFMDDGKRIVPICNTSKQKCYKALAKIKDFVRIETGEYMEMCKADEELHDRKVHEAFEDAVRQYPFLKTDNDE